MLLCVWLLPGLAPPARAGCYADLLGKDAPFAERIEHDPQAAIALIDAQLSAPARGTGRPSRAHLYAMRADALESIGNVDAARSAVEAGGQALTPADDALLRRRLRLTASLLLKEQGHLDRAMIEFGPDSAESLGDVPDLACVLYYRGSLRFRAGQNVGAAEDFMRAYQLARNLGRAEVRLLAGQMLARLYAKYDLYTDAHELADEAIGFYSASRGPLRLADAFFLRGDINLSQDDYVHAADDFLRARALLESAALPLEVVFAWQELCVTASRDTRRMDASAVCREAYERTRATDDPEGVKMMLGALGEIAFRGGHPAEAVGLWDRALGDDGVDFPPRMRWRFHRLRAQALTRIGDVAAAARDENYCLDALEADRSARSAEQLALLHVKFETSFKDEELARSRAEMQAAELTISRQAFIRNAVIGAAVLAVVTVLFATRMWSRRKLAVDARKAAEQQLAAVGRLTGGIAHDFNNLLSVMLQALWLLGRRASVAEDSVACDLVSQARRSSEICADITSQLLSFARQQNLVPEAVRLGACLADLRPLLERTVGSAAGLYIEVEEPEPVAWADPRQLSAALLNLVTNARDAMISGGKILIRVCNDSGRRVRLDVVDDGCGMASDILARAIEPFFTTKPVGRGSGLGRSMVDGFATQSGGALSVSSVLHRGTTVSLWLPAMVS